MTGGATCVICFSLDTTELAWDGVTVSVLAWKLEQIEASDSCVDLFDPSVAITPHHGMSVGYVYNIMHALSEY